MTGYGRYVSHDQKRQITIEVKTVNHRYLDISCKIPRELYPYENELKKQMKGQLKRGRVDVYISCAGEQLTDKKMQVDWDVFEQYLNNINALQERGMYKGLYRLNTFYRWKIYSISKNLIIWMNSYLKLSKTDYKKL